MNDMLNKLEGAEVLQLSYLEKYNWPETDPSTVDQPVQTWNRTADELTRNAATLIRLTPERFLEQTRALPTHLKLLWLLSHDSFNFNGVTRVREEPKWIARLEKLVAAGKPIPIPYPLFCAIANPAKQITRPGVNAGERAAILLFQYLDALANLVYAPGIHVHILSDATLYNNALQNTPAYAANYIAGARRLVDELDAEQSVTIHDYSELLGPYTREFDRLYNAFYARLMSGDPGLLPADERARLLRSVRASVNTERFGLSWTDIRLLFGPNRGAGHPLAAELDRMAAAALNDQLAIKLACVALDLPEMRWPGHIRASCHKGLKSGVAVVGLRVHPEYYSRSQLLPYHGKPLIRADGRMVVQPEFALRSRPELTRVVNEPSDSLLYIETP